MTGRPGILDACLHPDEWLFEAPPDRPFLLTAGSLRLMPMGTVGLLVGPGGISKTTLACQLATSVASGTNLFGQFQVHHPGHVLLAAGEESELDLRRRLHFAAAPLAASPDAHHLVGERLLALPGSGLDLRLMQSLSEMRFFLSGEALEQRVRQGTSGFISLWAERLLQEMYESGYTWSLIVFDPATRFGGADFEVDAHAATKLVEILETFTTLPGSPCVLLVHHTTKSSRHGVSDATSARGTSSLSDGARWQLNLEPVPDPDEPQADHPSFVRMRPTKTNLTARPRRPFLFARGPEGILRLATDEEVLSLQGEAVAAKGATAGKNSRSGAAAKKSPKKPVSRPSLKVLPQPDGIDIDDIT